jgi:WhiB family redox-sensing transcriptional regulator
VSNVAKVPAPPVRDWPHRACEGVDTNLFFNEASGNVHKRKEAAAKAVCQRCPALRHCLAYALPIVDLWGVWAGMNAGERTRARKQQQKEA